MKTICYVIPYFGKFPQMFPMWLESCKHNSTIDWLIFTDDKSPFDYPDNVHVFYTSFSDIKSRIQSLYDFSIALKSPYGLCDYKVAYGHIFEKELSNYDFWGYCDIDLVFGDIRHFLTDEVLNEYDKIGWRGHSTLFKNDEQCRYLYMQQMRGIESYKDLFQREGNSFFDESQICKMADEAGMKTYSPVVFADISPLFWNFRLSFQRDDSDREKDKHRIFSWQNGTLKSISVYHGELAEDEYMYVHFLRRNMRLLSNVNRGG